MSNQKRSNSIRMIIAAIVLIMWAVSGHSRVYASELVSRGAAYGEFEYEINNGGVSITAYHGSGGRVIIPSSIGGYPVTRIGENVFYMCYGLTDVKIPDSVKIIDECAFRFCISLTNVIIPDGVTIIGGGAFEDCGRMVSVTIPTSVNYIGEYAFETCSYWYEEITGTSNIPLRDIYYNGTKRQWSKIAIGSNNSELFNAVLHCIDDITIIKQPEDCKGTTYKDTLNFTVKAETIAGVGKSLNYRWQVSEDDGVTWQDLDGAFSGYNTDSLKVKALQAADGYQYRCRVWNDTESVVSDAAKLNVLNSSIIRITKQPKDFPGTKWVTAFFVTEASDTRNTGNAIYSVQYQWQVSQAPGKPWEDLSYATEGSRSKELRVTMISKKDGNRYRCVVKGGPGNKELSVSKVAKISIDNNHSVHSFEETLRKKASPSENGKVVKRCPYCGREEITIIDKPYAIKLSKDRYVYNGSKKKPGVTVITKKGVAIKDSNYKISYKNNQNVGTAVVQVTFMGKSYKGTMEAKFQIIAADIRVKDTIKDKSSGGVYEIVSTGSKNKTVKYKKPIRKNSKRITIPSKIKIMGDVYKVVAIGENAFKNNKQISDVKLPSDIETIGANAFKNCIKLERIVIPSKVKTIGKNAFNGCLKLKAITIKSKKLKNVGKYAFKGIYGKAKIKVPAKKLKEYKKLLKNKGQGKNVTITK